MNACGDDNNNKEEKKEESGSPYHEKYKMQRVILIKVKK